MTVPTVETTVGDHVLVSFQVIHSILHEGQAEYNYVRLVLFKTTSILAMAYIREYLIPVLDLQQYSEPPLLVLKSDQQPHLLTFLELETWIQRQV